MSDKPKGRITRTFRGAGYTVRVWPRNPSVLTFEVYEVIGTEADGNVLWQRAGAANSCDFSKTGLDDAEWYMRGDLKWDGCVNYNVNQEECMLHVCGPGAFVAIAALWHELYRLAQSFMPHHSWAELQPLVPEHVDHEDDAPNNIKKEETE